MTISTSTINATWSGNATAYRETLYVDEYSYTGTVAFDKEAAYISADHNVTGTAINQPSITPSLSGELLYAGAQGTSQIATGTQGLWTMQLRIARTRRQREGTTCFSSRARRF